MKIKNTHDMLFEIISPLKFQNALPTQTSPFGLITPILIQNHE